MAVRGSSWCSGCAYTMLGRYGPRSGKKAGLFKEMNTWKKKEDGELDIGNRGAALKKRPGEGILLSKG